jgi:hypothetical protein
MMDCCFLTDNRAPGIVTPMESFSSVVSLRFRKVTVIL